MIVCTCMNISDSQIRALIRQGYNLKEIANTTGASTDCSTCKEQIEEMLNEHSSKLLKLGKK